MRIKKDKEVDILKLMAIILPVLVAMSGFLYMQYNNWLEPDFTDAQYYTAAWMDYGVNQNTLNVEFVPDLKGAVFPAIGEALKRVDAKSERNPKIDDKPILIIMYMRDKTKLVEAGRVLVTHQDIHVMETGTFEEKQQLIKDLRDKAEYTFTQHMVMIERDGRFQYVPVNETNFNAENAYREYLKKQGDQFYE